MSSRFLPFCDKLHQVLFNGILTSLFKYLQLETLLSDIGGQMGLFIGISVISLAEFGELLISLCMVAARKSRDRKKTKSSGIELT